MKWNKNSEEEIQRSLARSGGNRDEHFTKDGYDGHALALRKIDPETGHAICLTSWKATGHQKSKEPFVEQGRGRIIKIPIKDLAEKSLCLYVKRVIREAKTC